MSRLKFLLLALFATFLSPWGGWSQTTKIAASTEAATPEQAAKVCDLRKFPKLPGAQLSGEHGLGALMYEAQAKVDAAFEFQRKHLTDLGFKPGQEGYADANMKMAHFLKDGFHVGVSVSAISGDPAKQGWVYVSLVNDGNVPVDKLPVPPGMKPFYPQPYQAAYTTTAKVAETAEACRKLILAAGWEPYSKANPGPDASMEFFKKNAIQLQVWVSTTPADGGKTLLRYDTSLLSVDLPLPPTIAEAEYTDSLKRLHFDAPNDQTDSIIAFYQKRLASMGWTPTTEKRVSDERTRSQFIVYRNAQKELLSLDLQQFTGIVRVDLKHQTAEELAEEERRMKEKMAQDKAEKERLNKKTKLALPLPPGAEKLEATKPHVWDFELPANTGMKVGQAYREYFAKAEWKEEAGAIADKNAGNITLKKGGFEITLQYFDSGFAACEFTVTGSSNLEFEKASTTLKLAEAPASPKTPEKGKKPAPPIPGIPELPPGVDLPDDVKDLLKKTLPK